MALVKKNIFKKNIWLKDVDHAEYNKPSLNIFHILLFLKTI